MNKTFFIILISVFAFIAVNTIFYFNIHNKQIDFQTSLLEMQTQLCGSTIEQDGSNFQNELTAIPFSDDFSRLFSDDGIRERGAENLQKLYTKYSELINKVTVYDDNYNVYSLILDLKNNFVSDYYISQRQYELRNREQLIINGDEYLYSMPGFDDNDSVKSNIVIEVNFANYVDFVFGKYLLEGTTWPWLISENGELLASAQKSLQVNQDDIDKISAEIIEGNEGFLSHSIGVDSIPYKMLSVYYPIRLVQRDLAIVFSMKTDIFLRSIIIKIIIISICSLVLLALLLFVHFRVVKVKTESDLTRRISEESLRKTIDALPLGLVLADPDGNIRLMSLAARNFLLKDSSIIENPQMIQDLGLEETPENIDESIYKSFLGSGKIVQVKRDKGTAFFFKREWTAQISNSDTRILIFFDITALEKSRNLENVTLLAKNDLLERMKLEIDVPADQIQEAILKLKKNNLSGTQSELVESIQKSRDLLSNLVDVITDFASKDAGKVILEEIPFSLHNEIVMAIDPFKELAANHNSSIITKIRNDVPDQVVGDPFRLRKVISSLVETSVELTRDGRILVSAELIDIHSDHAKIRLQIEDTGSGLNVTEIEKFMTAKTEEIPDDLEKLILRFTLARRHAELMKGQLWFGSPSSISTDPNLPGIKSSFTIEVQSKESAVEVFSDVSKYSDIKCLVLSQKKDSPEAVQLKLLDQLGLNLKYLIYRPDNLDSLIDLVREKSSDIHMLLLVDSGEEDGFELAIKLKDSGIVLKAVKIMFSTQHSPENIARSKKLEIDHYLEDPLESHSLFKIISSHFPGIPIQETSKAPKGVKIDPGISILLAEDNLFNRKVAQALFKSIGFEIDLAGNGNEVLKMLDQKQYDIVFMDLLMPEMDGIETTSAIRKLGHEMPIIALTAIENDNTKKSAIAAGINDYLVKPASAEDVRNILLRTFSKTL
jgi:CheY-like chemotaxis protein/signal transduction histidine kinase